MGPGDGLGSAADGLALPAGGEALAGKRDALATGEAADIGLRGFTAHAVTKRSAHARAESSFTAVSNDRQKPGLHDMAGEEGFEPSTF